MYSTAGHSSIRKVITSKPYTGIVYTICIGSTSGLLYSPRGQHWVVYLLHFIDWKCTLDWISCFSF